MGAVPPEMPDKMPEADPIEAMPGAPELQTPPAVASVSVIAEPMHTVEGPPIAGGNGLMVTCTVAVSAPSTQS